MLVSCINKIRPKLSQKRSSANAITRAANSPPDNRLIAYPNGILNIDTGELLDFDPKWQTNYVISDYDFNSTADCPMFCAMLESALPDELDRLVLQECFGYLFFPDKRHEVVTLLVGKGQDGKSTVIDAVSNALGKNNITSYSLTHITDERGYAIAGMVGKLGNICFESGSLRIGNEALYKSYASGEPMFARQLYKDGYLTTDYPASVVAVNNLPAKDSIVVRKLLPLKIQSLPTR